MQRRLELRAANLDRWSSKQAKAPDTTGPVVSLARITTLGNKLPRITLESRDQILGEIEKLALTKFTTELAEACTAMLLQLKSTTNLDAAVDVVSCLHQRLPTETFTSRVVSGTLNAPWPASASALRLRIRTVFELFLCGLVDQQQFFDYFKSALDLASKSDTTVCSLIRLFQFYGPILLGLEPETADLCITIRPKLVQELCKYSEACSAHLLLRTAQLNISSFFLSNLERTNLSQDTVALNEVIASYNSTFGALCLDGFKSIEPLDTLVFLDLEPSQTEVQQARSHLDPFYRDVPKLTKIKRSKNTVNYASFETKLQNLSSVKGVDSLLKTVALDDVAGPKPLVRLLSQPPSNGLALPFQARFLTGLQLTDVAELVLEKMQPLVKETSQHRNVRYLGELIKFGFIDPVKGLDIVTGLVSLKKWDILLAFAETCGSYYGYYQTLSQHVSHVLTAVNSGNVTDPDRVLIDAALSCFRTDEASPSEKTEPTTESDDIVKYVRAILNAATNEKKTVTYLAEFLNKVAQVRQETFVQVFCDTESLSALSFPILSQVLCKLVNVRPKLVERVVDYIVELCFQESLIYRQCCVSAANYLGTMYTFKLFDKSTIERVSSRLLSQPRDSTLVHLLGTLIISSGGRKEFPSVTEIILDIASQIEVSMNCEQILNVLRA